MSTRIERAPVATPAERATPRPDLAGAITAGVLIWRDRTVRWQTVVAGVVLAVMIAFSGHDDVLMEAGLILVAVTLAQAIWSDARRPHASRPPRPGRASTT